MANDDQIDYWNGPAGQKWVDQSSRLDAMLAPFADGVLSAANIQSGERVLDIGCGAGALTLRAAAAAAPDGRALGVDVSAPLLELARQRAKEACAAATFELADASVYKADPHPHAVISRFGVMFFADPEAAFANIRAATAPGGRLAFMCWQALQANDWAFAPLQAALAFLKEAPASTDPTAPGPFAFADKDRLGGLLASAGWRDVEIAPHTTEIALPGDDVEDSARFMMTLGPLARLIAAQEIDPGPVEAALVERLRRHLKDDGTVKMASACWLVTAARG